MITRPQSRRTSMSGKNENEELCSSLQAVIRLIVELESHILCKDSKFVIKKSDL